MRDWAHSRRLGTPADEAGSVVLRQPPASKLANLFRIDVRDHALGLVTQQLGGRVTEHPPGGWLGSRTPSLREGPGSASVPSGSCVIPVEHSPKHCVILGLSGLFPIRHFRTSVPIRSRCPKMARLSTPGRVHCLHENRHRDLLSCPGCSRRPLRRALLRRRDDDGNLLPAHLLGTDTGQRPLPVLRQRRRGRTRGFPPVPAVPPRSMHWDELRGWPRRASRPAPSTTTAVWRRLPASSA